MSGGPMDVVRSLYGAMRSRDLDELRRLGRQNPRFEWSSSADELDSAPRMAPAAALEYTRELFEIFDQVQTEIVEEVEVGEERIILVVEHRVRGAASGIETSRREVHLWTFEDGEAISLQEFTTLGEAQEAARVR